MQVKKLAVLTAAIAALGLLAVAPASSIPPPGGPIVLVGIDAEDGGPGGHGPIANYVTLVSDMLADASKGANILVVGGGKSPFDSPTSFWDAIDASLAESVTYVNGAGAISAVSFAPYRLVAIVSDEFNTFFGGLTAGEDAAIDARAADLAAHVNSGGGVLGFSSSALPGPYAYIATLAPVTTATPPQFSNIDPTLDGIAVGITDALDVCCWHDTFLSFPAFFDVLAYRGGTLQAAAIGGQNVVVPTMGVSPLNATNDTGTQHCVTATLVDQNSAPLPGETIVFTVSGANSGGGTVVTDGSGLATFCYVGANAGDDDIEAFADIDKDGVQDAGEPFGLAEKTWIAANADISVLKAAPALVQNGSSLTYSIVVANAGPAAANNVVVTDTIPAGTTLVSASPECSGTTTITCTLASLAAGASHPFSITVGVNTAASSITNTASGASDQSDPNPGDNSSTATTAVNHAPSCSSATISGPSMWPPNHKMRSFSIGGGSDPDGNPVSLTITSVFQDEPTNSLGDGNTAPDAVITSPTSVDLRGERQGGKNGRVYYVNIAGSDGQGGSCTGTLTVGVPHDQGPKGGPVGDGQLFDSTV